MKIHQIMSRNITTIKLTTTLREAAEMMRREDVGAFPVVDPAEDKIKGMLTDRDIVVRAAALGKDLENTFAQEVMTEKVRYVFEDEDISKAADAMQDKQIRRLLVLNRSKRLVGLVALSDLAVKGQDERLSADVIKGVSETVAQHAIH